MGVIIKDIVNKVAKRRETSVDPSSTSPGQDRAGRIGQGASHDQQRNNNTHTREGGRPSRLGRLGRLGKGGVSLIKAYRQGGKAKIGDKLAGNKEVSFFSNYRRGGERAGRGVVVWKEVGCFLEGVGDEREGGLEGRSIEH